MDLFKYTACECMSQINSMLLVVALTGWSILIFCDRKKVGNFFSLKCIFLSRFFDGLTGNRGVAFRRNLTLGTPCNCGSYVTVFFKILS